MPRVDSLAGKGFSHYRSLERLGGGGTKFSASQSSASKAAKSMAQLQIAMMGQPPYTTLRDAAFAHPTLAESLNNLFCHFQD